MNAFDLLFISVIAIIPQLGFLVYNFYPKKGHIRVQEMNKSLYIILSVKKQFFIGGIVIHEPLTNSDDSILDFIQKFDNYLPMTIKLVKKSKKAEIYLFLFDYKKKLKSKPNFDNRMQKLSDTLDNTFTPRKIHIMTGKELCNRFKDDYGNIPNSTMKEGIIYNGKTYSCIFEFANTHEMYNSNKHLFLLNCILEYGLEINLSFRFIKINNQYFVSSQIQINDNKMETVLEGIKILRKGGSLLLSGNSETIENKKKIENTMSERALQLVPYKEKKTNQSNILEIIQFCIQNTQEKRSFSITD